LLCAGVHAGDDRATVPDVLVRQHSSIVPRIAGAPEDYARNCQGCHGHFGYSVDEIPVLKDRVGYFVHTPQGRAYLVRVPNVAQAHLDDERLARLLNWLLRTYSAAQLPADFVPYTPEEVGILRRHKPEQVIVLRKQVVSGLVAQGVVPDAEVLHFGNE
jgi:hypothetical protein